MSLWASLKRAAAAAVRVVAGLIEAPIDALLRPFEGYNAERDAVARKLGQINARLAEREVQQPRPRPAPVVRSRSWWQTQDEVDPTGRYAPLIGSIRKELDRIVVEARTQAFRQAGGVVHPYLDHLTLLDDVGLAQAIEISGHLAQLGEARPWDFVTRRGETTARAELLGHLEAQGWWRRRRQAG